MDADIAVAFFFGSIAGAHFMIFIMAILAAGSRRHDRKRVLYTELPERKEG